MVEPLVGESVEAVVVTIAETQFGAAVEAKDGSAVRSGAGAVHWGTALLQSLVACVGAIAVSAGAQEPVLPTATPFGLHRIELHVDNDTFAFGRADRWYTSGVHLRGLRPVAPGGAADALAGWWCRDVRGCGARSRRWVVIGAGQQLYSPASVWRDTPQPYDRPYAGWLFGSTAVLIEGAGASQMLGLRAGAVGPQAQGELAQNSVHRLLRQRQARGWQFQRRSMIGVQADHSGLASWSLAGDVDVVGRYAVSAGTVALEAAVGAVVRWGSLPDVPTYPNQPTMAGAVGAGTGDWYAFAGAELRAVGWDRLVDGPVIGYTSQVRHRPWVPEAFAGLSFRIAPAWRLELTMTVRAPEFEADVDPVGLRPQTFGSVLLRWSPGA